MYIASSQDVIETRGSSVNHLTTSSVMEKGKSPNMMAFFVTPRKLNGKQTSIQFVDTYGDLHGIDLIIVPLAEVAEALC